MVAANELKKGNLILGKSEIVIVRNADEKGINRADDEVIAGVNVRVYEFWLDSLFPIPVTPEILQRAGFQYLDYWVKGESEFKDEFELNQLPVGFVLKVGEYNKGKVFKYVHQLQTLYFAITGEELEIKDL